MDFWVLASTRSKPVVAEPTPWTSAIRSEPPTDPWLSSNETSFGVRSIVALFMIGWLFGIPISKYSLLTLDVVFVTFDITNLAD